LSLKLSNSSFFIFLWFFYFFGMSKIDLREVGVDEEDRYHKQ
jgi:hypothetical protein